MSTSDTPFTGVSGDGAARRLQASDGDPRAVWLLGAAHEADRGDAVYGKEATPRELTANTVFKSGLIATARSIFSRESNPILDSILAAT